MLVLGGPGVVAPLRDLGIETIGAAEPALADIVLVGWDDVLTYAALRAACESIWAGAPLLATSTASVFSVNGGAAPGWSGAVAAGIRQTTGARALTLGKPSPVALREACRALGVKPARTLVVGDDLELEIAMARRTGARSALVLTGVGTREAAAARPPARRPGRHPRRRHGTRGGLELLPSPRDTEEEIVEQSTESRTGIPEAELEERRARLLDHVRRERLEGYVLFDAHYIQYFTGFWFLATERPVAFAQNAAGEMAVFVPEFEIERVRAETAFERVESYPEYPGVEHPMHVLAGVLTELGFNDPIGADHDGYPGILGYQGPSLGTVTATAVFPLAAVIERMMVRKSPREIALIRESGRWCAHAHRLLQEYTRPGVTEAQASLRAGHEATLAMLEELADGYGGQLASADGVSAGYRGQIGLRSSWAHAIAHNIEFQPGDVLVSETSAPVWGYHAELERALIIGPPTDEVRRLFEHTVAAQRVALGALRPGVTCADVDGAVMRYFEDNDLLPHWRQHTGHAIGLRNHEAPFLDRGDHTRVEPGMVFTLEPGVYSASIGGFRHSDTVAVTEDGIDVLTDYPSDIDSLTLPS